MNKVAAVLAIPFTLALAFFCNLSQACQPAWEGSYVFELADGKHVFAMKSHGEFDYPASGVYVKGDTSTPVWIWQGGYVGQRVMETRISRNGQYVVQSHMPEVHEDKLLSIYKSGKEVHTFGMKPLLDNVSQVEESWLGMCGPFYSWIRDSNYDKSAERFKVETMADRIVTIDVPTGEVLSLDKVKRIRVNGIAQLTDDRQVQIHDIGNCADVTNLLSWKFVRKADGVTDVPVFVGEETTEVETLEDGSVVSSGRFVMVPLDAIKSLIPVEDAVQSSFSVQAKLVDGSTHKFSVDPRFWYLCGKDSNGGPLKIEIKDLKSLIITSPVTEV